MIRVGTGALDDNSVVIGRSLDEPRANALRTAVENICNSVGNLDPDNDATPYVPVGLAPCSYLDHPRGTKSMALPWSVGGLERL